MKKLLLLLIVPFLSFGQDLTYIPDDAFEVYLEENGLGDGIFFNDYVLTENIVSITNLSMTNQNISDLTGLEDFINLESIYLMGNNLSTINVSNNASLRSLWCGLNQITSIDVSNNALLEELGLYGNQLDSINLENNPNLLELVLNNNNLSNIDLSNNINITSIGLDGNNLSNIDLSNNINIVLLGIGNNNITYVDLASNNNLSNIDLSGNNISSLDISNLDLITEIRCQNCNLTYLNLQNGNNVNFSFLAFQQNPGLNCVQVDDVSWANYYWEDYFDDDVIFELKCMEKSSLIEKPNSSKKLVKNVDILGRETTNKGFQLHIYDDGSVEKKYLIK